MHHQQCSNVQSLRCVAFLAVLGRDGAVYYEILAVSLFVLAFKGPSAPCLHVITAIS